MLFFPRPEGPPAAEALLSKLLDRTPSILPARPRPSGVALYGAGELGQMACDFLSHVGVPVRCVMDRSASPGMRLAGFDVQAPAPRKGDGETPLLVTTVSAPFGEIALELHRLGWKTVLPFYDFAIEFTRTHPLSNGWFSGPLTEKDRKQIHATLVGLCDDHSRAAYLQFLAWRIMREDWLFERVSVDPTRRYWIGPVVSTLSDKEHFVDAGAYDGRVLARLLQVTGGCFTDANLFEPDPSNFRLLDSMVRALPPDIRNRVHAAPVALAEYSGQHSFSHGFGFSSRLGATRSCVVQTTCLDDLELAPTLVKLHLEGGELAAIQGASATLVRHRPIVMATTYHCRDGLWRIQRRLMECLADYLFYFRLHAWCATGAVIYAIPAERRKDSRAKL